MHGTPIVGGAVYSAREDIVICGDLDGNLYALDGTTGAEVWVKSQVDPQGIPSPDANGKWTDQDALELPTAP